jgi:16S rRNA (guanine527-N7)-methyltransferase
MRASPEHATPTAKIAPGVPEQLPGPDALRRDAAALGVALDANAAARVLEFGALVLRWNRTYNLVSRKDEDRLYHRHLLDSLSVAPWLSGSRVMDLGTGAGFPGVPLAIASPERTFVLVDRSARKVRLVRQAARLLRLANVTAVEADAAALAEDRELVPFDVVVSRAVAAPDALWRLAEPLLAPAGRVLVMAHAQGGAEGGDEPRAPAGARIAAVERLAIPGLPHPHGLVVMEQTARAESTAN